MLNIVLIDFVFLYNQLNIIFILIIVAYKTTMKLIDRFIRNIRNLFRKKADMRMRNTIIEYNLAYAIINKKLKNE